MICCKVRFVGSLAYDEYRINWTMLHTEGCCRNTGQAHFSTTSTLVILRWQGAGHGANSNDARVWSKPPRKAGLAHTHLTGTVHGG